MIVYYDKIKALLDAQGKKVIDIRKEKIIGQATWHKLLHGTGMYADYKFSVPGTDDKKPKTKLVAIDTVTLEKLCVWLNCDISQIMEYIPNTYENADRLCEILGCTREELPEKVPMIEEP